MNDALVLLGILVLFGLPVLLAARSYSTDYDEGDK